MRNIVPSRETASVKKYYFNYELSLLQKRIAPKKKLLRKESQFCHAGCNRNYYKENHIKRVSIACKGESPVFCRSPFCVCLCYEFEDLT